MSDIRLITNSEFDQLLELTIEMYKVISTETSKDINSFQAVNTLIHQINSEANFTAVGLFDENVLIGFVTGHDINPEVFYFSGIHLVHKNREETKELIEYCFNMVEERGYKAWEVDATNDNISSIMEKYKAEKQYTRYRKDIIKEQDNG